MERINYTVAQNGETISSTMIMSRAVIMARATAVDTGKDASVIVTRPGAEDVEVIFHPDGSNENIWRMDKGHRLQAVVGEVYTNRGGGRYRCIALTDNGPMFYNFAGGCSTASAVFQNVESGWTFTAKGILQFVDGTIEWGHSIGGHFEEVTA